MGRGNTIELRKWLFTRSPVFTFYWKSFETLRIDGGDGSRGRREDHSLLLVTRPVPSINQSKQSRNPFATARSFIPFCCSYRATVESPVDCETLPSSPHIAFNQSKLIKKFNWMSGCKETTLLTLSIVSHVGWNQWNLFNFFFMGETNYLIYLFMFTLCLRMCCIIRRVGDNGIALFPASHNFLPCH